MKFYDFKGDTIYCKESYLKKIEEYEKIEEYVFVSRRVKTKKTFLNYCYRRAEIVAVVNEETEKQFDITPQPIDLSESDLSESEEN